MYLTCTKCGHRSHISTWKRVPVGSIIAKEDSHYFACPNCGALLYV